jgi:hypothetical protein
MFVPFVDAVYAMEGFIGNIEHVTPYDGCAFRVHGSRFPPWRRDPSLEQDGDRPSGPDTCLLVP